MRLLDGTDNAFRFNRKLSVAARSRSAAGYFRGEDASGRNAHPFGSGLPAGESSIAASTCRKCNFPP